MTETVEFNAALIVESNDELSESELETAPSAPTSELILVAIDQ